MRPPAHMLSMRSRCIYVQFLVIFVGKRKGSQNLTGRTRGHGEKHVRPITVLGWSVGDRALSLYPCSKVNFSFYVAGGVPTALNVNVSFIT